MKNLILSLSVVGLLASCNYSNEFTGSFNGTPATLSAYSKNINKYCVSLAIKQGVAPGSNGTVVKNSFISAQAVYDPNDLLKPVFFNTKGAGCSVNLDHYLVGSRKAEVLGNRLVTRREYTNLIDWCQMVTYKQYQYKEKIDFEVRALAGDQTQGQFAGTGAESSYVDLARPVSAGPVFYCGTYNGPYPGPGYPGGYPRPFPGPYPGPGYPRGPGGPRPW